MYAGSNEDEQQYIITHKKYALLNISHQVNIILGIMKGKPISGESIQIHNAATRIQKLIAPMLLNEIEKLKKDKTTVDYSIGGGGLPDRVPGGESNV